MDSSLGTIELNSGGIRIRTLNETIIMEIDVGGALCVTVTFLSGNAGVKRILKHSANFDLVLLEIVSASQRMVYGPKIFIV